MKDRKSIITVTKKDLKFEFFRCGGKGGQKQNKTSSGVRIKHLKSGAVAECRETRSQHKNKSIAFRRMAESKKFQQWIKIESNRKLGVTDEIDPEEIKRKVDKEMQNVKVEGKNENGKWIKI